MQLTKLLYFAQAHATISDQQQQIEDAPPGWHLSANFQGGKVLKALSPVHLRQCAPLAADTIEHEAIFHLECAEVKAKAVRVIA